MLGFTPHVLPDTPTRGFVSLAGTEAAATTHQVGPKERIHRRGSEVKAKCITEDVNRVSLWESVMMGKSVNVSLR